MWLELIISVDEAHAEDVSDALMEAGALSVSVEDEWADTESEVPLYGEPGLEPTTHAWQQSRLVVLVEPDTDVDALLSEAYGELNLPVPSYERREVQAQDWVRLTQSQFEPIEITPQLWIVPTWHEADERDAGRINLPKALLYAINGGVDEQSGVLVIQGLEPFWSDVLEYEDVVARLDKVLDWLAVNCVDSFNAAHFLHERQGESGLAMALHDCHAAYVMACSLEGLAVLADSLSAIRYAGVQIVRDEDGLAVGFHSDEPYPACGRIGGVADAVALATSLAVADGDSRAE